MLATSRVRGDRVIAAASMEDKALGGADVERKRRRAHAVEADPCAVRGDGEGLSAIAAIHQSDVVAVAPLESVAAVAGVPDHGVVAGLAEHLVIAGAASQHVVAVAPKQKIIAALAEEGVGAGLAEQQIIA